MKDRCAPSAFPSSRQRGFSLFELMVAAIIVAILASIAIPIYSNYVIRGKIPEATSALATKRMAMEQYFQDNHNYTGADAAGWPCAADTNTSRYFTFSCTPSPLPANAQAYTITATGQGTMKGFSYTLDQNNAKTSNITAPAPSAWLGQGANCWITGQNHVC